MGQNILWRTRQSRLLKGASVLLVNWRFARGFLVRSK